MRSPGSRPPVSVCAVGFCLQSRLFQDSESLAVPEQTDCFSCQLPRRASPAQSPGFTQHSLSQQASLVHFPGARSCTGAKWMLLGHLDHRPWGWGRHRPLPFPSQELAAGNLSHLQVPNTGSRTEQGAARVLHLGLHFLHFPWFSFCLRDPQCPWTWPSTFGARAALVDSGYPWLSVWVTAPTPCPSAPQLHLSQGAPIEPTARPHRGCGLHWHTLGPSTCP